MVRSPFDEISWHRLPVTLLGKKSSSVMESHPVSVIQAIIKAVSSKCEPFANSETKIPPIFHLKNKKHTYKLNPLDQVMVEILFFNYQTEEVCKWKECLMSYFSDQYFSRTFELLNINDIQERNYEILFSESGLSKSEGEICLDFLVPVPFPRDKTKNRTYINRDNFIGLFEKHFARIFNKKFAYESHIDDFSILPYYWNYTEIQHQSKSQPGELQYINGCAGKLYIKGKFLDFLPYIILGSEVHVGTKLSNSQGYYRIFEDSLPYFKKVFPEKKIILTVVKDVIERYDQATESLSQKEMYPFNEEKFADQLFNELNDNKYEPSPNTAFIIKSKNEKDRLVEQLDFKDLIVNQYILSVIQKNFDNILEEESIGYRKGISREKAINMVDEAIKEGFDYAIESDIEDFFPSVDLEILKKLIEFYIPIKDFLIKNILIKIIYNGYNLKKKYYERQKGLALGNPLSPILSNIYLDSFDEKVKKLDVKLIRYSDDFIILCRSQESAESLLSKTNTILSEIGLQIKKEKTAITPIKDGFRFLGMTFGKIKPDESVSEAIIPFKKPLYITEPYVFLSLNGDAIDIKKNRKIIETIPVRRIGEIMVMEKTSFSTALLRMCVDNNIPFTICLNTGYYITTIKPDSKKYYDISYEHVRKFYSLSDTELLCIAKEFAIGKLTNYITFFKQRYKKGQHILINELFDFISRINQAGSVEEVRGIEGIAARRIYEKLNDHIDNNSFYLEKRMRRFPDRINSLLNFGYYLLFSRINATVRGVGLNPYLGFLHSTKDDYESLVCDIEELFRSRIVRFIVRLINLNIIIEDDFIESNRGFYLKREGVFKYLSHFEKEMNIKNLKNTLSLKEHIYCQVMIIKNWVLLDKNLSFYKWE